MEIKKRLLLSGCLILNDNNEVLLLYKKQHKHYETPGGKVEIGELSDPKNPTIAELAKTAKRELYEEIGANVKIKELEYFGKVEFTIPDGRLAIANKFLTKIISGTPIINEPEIFERFDYLPIQRLEEYPISPDLKLLVNKLKAYIKK